jgi:predicted DNA-binding transcriptional regulator YafY
MMILSTSTVIVEFDCHKPLARSLKKGVSFMRADRLLSILLLLQVHQRMTAGDLAQRLEVSERTIQRDMVALSAAGIPVMAERGIGGGWSLLDGYETKLTGLNEAEVKTLFLSKPARLLADLGLHQASKTAFDKLLAALPAMYRRDAEYIRQRIYIDETGWGCSEENVSFLPTLQEAIWQERRLQLTYHLSTGPIVECLLDPLGLVARGSVWYLVAIFKGEVCVYRVSRVQAAEITAQSCVRPKAFDLAAFWIQSSANFRASLLRYAATLRVAPTVFPRLRHSGRCGQMEQADPPDADGWRYVSMQFETEEEACGYVLSFGPQIEVVEPQALRDKVINTAESVTTFYAHRSHNIG